MLNWLIPLNENDESPKYVQIYAFIRKEILEGKVIKGTKLPSIRQMSDTLSVSKSTVENAYQQLVVEGYVENKNKSGYYVNALENFNASWLDTQGALERQPVTYKNKTQVSRTDGIEPSSFQISEWKKAMNHVLEYQSEQLLTAGDVQGELRLREEIAQFIHTTRAGICSPDQIVIGAGIQYLFGLVATLFRKDNTSIAFEYPGFSKGMYIFEDYGYSTYKIPVTEEGIDLKTLEAAPVKMVYVSPSHQYPTGSVMPIQKRVQLLDWAIRKNAYIIEDDYDSLLRYEGNPVPALQGLKVGAPVIYMGSFSKLLSPALRISFMILPQELMPLYNDVKNRYSQSVSKIEQLALANFMMEGVFERHVRRIRKIYGRKNALLVEAFRKQPTKAFKLVGKESGLHVVLSFKPSVNLEKVLSEAKTSGLSLEGADDFDSNGILVFPYSGIPDDEIESKVNQLIEMTERIWNE